MSTTASIRRSRPRAILAAALTAAVLAVALTAATTAQAAPVVSAAYATVQGNEADVGQSTPLPATKAFASNFEQPTLFHAATGSYTLTFPALGKASEGGVASGVVNARAVGAIGNCMSDDLENLTGSNGTAILGIGVQCSDDRGNAADIPFTVSYTRGGTQSGQLVTARVDQDAAAGKNVVIIPAHQESSVGGSVTVAHPTPGDYRFNLPVLKGPGSSSLAVSPMGGFHGRARVGATCSVKDTALIAGGTINQVRVTCRTPGDSPGPDGEAADPGLAITYAKDINLLGFKSGLSTAYLTMPKTTAPFTVLDASHAHDQIFGQTSGAVTVLRKKAGTYQVDLQNQEGGHAPDTAIVTAQGANAVCRSNASVTIPGNDAQTLLVTCRTITGQPVDSAFRLAYTVHE